VIKKFADGDIILFDSGKFDEWCVYHIKADGSKKIPRDVEYFTKLKELSSVYDSKNLYEDFVKIYEKTNSKIAQDILDLISDLSKKYLNHSLEVEKIFVIIYGGMIAEENKRNAIVKKKMKRLGIHQILIEKYDPKRAANFSKGKKAKELLDICKSLGF